MHPGRHVHIDYDSRLVVSQGSEETLSIMLLVIVVKDCVHVDKKFCAYDVSIDKKFCLDLIKQFFRIRPVNRCSATIAGDGESFNITYYGGFKCLFVTGNDNTKSCWVVFNWHTPNGQAIDKDLNLAELKVWRMMQTSLPLNSRKLPIELHSNPRILK
uniref:Uncharacterized protein n=1 Tax=Ananas comosus var. bracteatus TaxID=296719 RepID=A0A6V7QM81_ANACO|nr:unnamed protein product [Ananas comosus var. bracteatus]